MMEAQFKKAEIRQIRVHLARLLPPGGRPPNAEEVVEIATLVEKTDRLIAANTGDVERGRKILEWRLSCSIAPTQNEATSWNRRSPYLFKKAKDILRVQLMAMLPKFPDADLCGGRRRRWIRVTRFTQQPKNVDEQRIDAVGGKLPVDVLKHSGLIVNDSPEWLVREAHVMKTAKGNKHVLLELFEVADEEVPCSSPEDGPAPPDPVARGPMTVAVTGGA